MKRRTNLIVAGACAIGMALFASGTGAAEQVAGQAGERQFYELRTYHFDTPTQQEAFVQFTATVGIPALNRLGVGPVGFFEPLDSDTELYLLVPHESLESVATLTETLLAALDDQEIAATAIDATLKRPLYTKVDSSLLEAFDGMPRVQAPTAAESRVFQLRIYRSPSAKTGQKKIAMFHDGEIDIFHRVGLNPVFFGRALAGSGMPNLTYMLAFDNPDAQKAAWKAFGKDAQWRELRARPEYQDLVSHITNIELRPAPGSQL